MVLSHKLFINHYGHGHIEQNDLALLIIANLHVNKKISDEKMKGMIASLRKGIFVRFVKTYHCKINDKWYNDENTLDIYKEVFNELCPKSDLTVDQFIPYINLLINKNKNYCIDHIYYQYVKPLIKNTEYWGSVDKLKSFDIKGLDRIVLSYEDADSKYSLGSGHCCEDCDGDYEDYKRMKYEYLYKKESDKYLKQLFKYHLFNLKTDSKFRNPNEKLKLSDAEFKEIKSLINPFYYS